MRLSAGAYARTGLPTGLLVCLCLLQAFGYRLRRVIAAFYFPKVHPGLSPDLPTPPGSAHTHTHTPAAGSSLGAGPDPLLLAQREKKRILFFYNELLRKRAAFTKLRRAAIVRQAREQRGRVSQARPACCGSRLGLRTSKEGLPPSQPPPGPRPLGVQ